MHRRNFLRAGICTSAAWVSGLGPALAADADIEITPRDATPQISPHVYGQFVEHLGGVIYDGIWVGENSKIPNVGGIRKDLINHLKRLKPPVIGWPGGCFADSYNWRDGVGPRNTRPRRMNFWQTPII